MIDDLAALRTMYAGPTPRAINKQLDRLDPHCARFIALSPFVVVASGDDRSLDASPRGGDPGFVKVLNERTLLIPDAPGLGVTLDEDFVRKYLSAESGK